jgi:hypothetical protein
VSSADPQRVILGMADRHPCGFGRPSLMRVLGRSSERQFWAWEILTHACPQAFAEFVFSSNVAMSMTQKYSRYSHGMHMCVGTHLI